MKKIDNFIDAERKYQDARKEAETEQKKYQNRENIKYTMRFISCFMFFILGCPLTCIPETLIFGLFIIVLSFIIFISSWYVRCHTEKYNNAMKKEEYLKANYIEAKDIHDETFRRLEWCHENFPEGRTWDDLNIVEKEGYLGMYIEKYKEKVISDSSEYNVSYIESVFCYFFKTTYEEVLNFYTNAINYYRSQEYEKELKAYENTVSKI